MSLSYVCMNDGQEQRRAKGTAVRSDVRTRLLDATISVLDTAGPEAATSRAIADAAGENLASITYYFGSKRELVNEAMITATRRLIQPVVVEFADDGRDSIAKLLSAVQQLYRILDAHGTLLGPYVQSLAAAATHDAIATEVRSLHRELASVLAAEISAQQHQGLLPDWVDPDSMAQLIVSLVNGVAVSIAIDPDETHPTAVGSQFAQLLLSVRAPTP